MSKKKIEIHKIPYYLFCIDRFGDVWSWKRAKPVLPTRITHCAVIPGSSLLSHCSQQYAGINSFLISVPAPYPRQWLEGLREGLDVSGCTPWPCRAFPSSRILGFAGLTDQTAQRCSSKLLELFCSTTKPEIQTRSSSLLGKPIPSTKSSPAPAQLLQGFHTTETCLLQDRFQQSFLPIILMKPQHPLPTRWAFQRAPALIFSAITQPGLFFHPWDAAALISRANGPQMLCQYRHETNTAGCQFGLVAKRWNHHLC